METININFDHSLKKWPEIKGLKAGSTYCIVLSDPVCRVTVLEFEDKLFRTNSAVVLPEREDPSVSIEERYVTSVGIIATCLRYAQEHPDDQILVTGHTDTAGNLDYNKKLSAWRAENITALLTNNGRRWAEVCNSWERITLKDHNQFLAWEADTFGWDCHPGKIDDSENGQTTNKFKVAYNKFGPGSRWAPEVKEYGGLNVGTETGLETWEAHFNVLQEYIANELGVDIEKLRVLQGQLKFLTPDKWVGCNEYHPRTAENLNDFPCDNNRRVEVMFVSPNDNLPTLTCSANRDSCSGTSCPIYNSENCRRVMIAPMQSAKPWHAKWSENDKKATMTTQKKMFVDAPGLAEGTPVRITVRQYIDEMLAYTLPVVNATSAENQILVPFDKWYAADRVVVNENMQAGDRFPKVSFDFIVEAAGRKQIAPPVAYGDRVYIQYSGDDTDVTNTSFELLTQWGILSGKTDASGVIDVDDIPPGGAYVLFEEHESEQ